jgi:hypothetical protein
MTQMRVMENLPFLSKPQENESEEWVPAVQHQKPDLLDSLRSNPMALVVIGIIVGALLMNMRPVIIRSA